MKFRGNEWKRMKGSANPRSTHAWPIVNGKVFWQHPTFSHSPMEIKMFTISIRSSWHDCQKICPNTRIHRFSQMNESVFYYFSLTHSSTVCNCRLSSAYIFITIFIIIFILLYYLLLSLLFSPACHESLHILQQILSTLKKNV